MFKYIFIFMFYQVCAIDMSAARYEQREKLTPGSLCASALLILVTSSPMALLESSSHGMCMAS